MNREIWVVDDDSLMGFVIKKLYSKLNILIPLRFFSNGKEALDSLKSQLENKSFLEEDKNSSLPTAPILVYLDINMPVMNGWEFLDNLTPDMQKLLNIVILTSSVNLEDKTIANKYPAIKSFLEKPLTFDAIIEVHKEWENK